MLKAIFFATFDVTEGPKVLHQVPTSSITASPSSPAIPLIHFPPISSLLIPHPTLCNSGLVTLTHSHHRILSYPQHIASPRYPRNAYTFNFCLVLAEEADFSSYVPVVRKLNALFRTLEEQGQFLSRDGAGKVYALCEILLEDLNNYSEAMIPIDAANTLNIKLFPTYPPPPPLHAHHVPLATVRLAGLVDENWDLTMLRLLPWIDGVNSVKQIALLADADFKLVRKAIRHLLYYGCVLLLDIFSFGAIYAPTAEVAAFVESQEMQAECARYVALGEGDGSSAEEGQGRALSGTQLAELYLSLRQGHSVKSWCMEHADAAGRIDVRRFVTFGVIKGFLYRVHKYALATSIHRSGSRRLTKANVHRSKPGEGQKKERMGGGVENVDLGKYLDGTHCFDEICTDLMISEKELTARLKAWGDVQIICR
ncbi:hypothetical protein HO133_009382 [Letharia lupina]|uniref:Nitrogen permease regulator 2 n=1 Tax=Letharia lupina TaxID=560253 RepID=A0A8H6CNV3_9LECA|nr:uncharacterized protein HO133_009382 [Letharia lupina]KAF6226516.1 hypothetical protein HO133_009382 [Letharia lupina]